MTIPRDPIHVLYLEDDPADIEMTLRHMARHAPHIRVTAVSSGQEALQRLETAHFDAILLDQCVPDRPGTEVLEEIIRRGIEIPALMVTGSGDTETAIRSLKAGAFDYVVKKEGYLAALPAAIQAAIARFRDQAPVSRRRSIRILYVENDPADADLTLRHLRAAAPHFMLEVAQSGPGALRRIDEAAFDLLVLDFRLPGMDGIQVLKEVHERRPRIPAILVTGTEDEETAAQALKLGALDFVIKRGAYLQRLPTIIENALIRHHLAEEREALSVLNGLARAVASSMDLDEIFRRVAEAACTLLKVDQCLLSRLADDSVTLQPAAWRGIPDDVARGLVLRLGQDLPGQAALHRRPVTAVEPAGEAAASAGRDVGGAAFTPGLCVPIASGERVLGVLSVASTTSRHLNSLSPALLAGLASHAAIAIQNARLYHDLKRSYDELKRSQDLLFRQEKMAALGRLAAGLAHELNNPLSAIAGFAERLQERAKAPEIAAVPTLADVPRHLKIIAEQAFRCGDLVHRLLTFARQREPQVKPMDLWQAVQETLALLPGKVRMLGQRFQAVRGAGDLQVLADANMFQQVILNLVTNALDAVEGGGTMRVVASRDDSGPEGGPVILEVADTGTGIAPEHMPHVFDPFFTTKGPERGTGLGLPICLSIVEQHGGTLEIQSLGPGLGATATVRLPAAP